MYTFPVISTVAGVTFEGRQAYLEQLTVGQPITIVPEPENEFDANALAVYAAIPIGLVKVGYIPRKQAMELGGFLEGNSCSGKVREITGGFEIWDGENASLGLRVIIDVPIDDVPE